MRQNVTIPIFCNQFLYILICLYLYYSFAEKSHLARHYSFHSEHRPYKCEVCQKMYKTERCLKVHSMVHAAERPFICKICSKRFLSSTKLKVSIINFVNQKQTNIFFNIYSNTTIFTQARNHTPAIIANASSLITRIG